MLSLMKVRAILALALCEKMAQVHVLIKFSHQDCLYHIDLEIAKEEESEKCIFVN